MMLSKKEFSYFSQFTSQLNNDKINKKIKDDNTSSIFLKRR